MNWTLLSATNNDAVLASCLLNSPDVRSASEVILQRGYSSAAVAYNRGLEQAKTDLVVLAHQDVYLPSGWADSLRGVVDLLAKTDPNWGVLGVWGVNKASEGGTGFLYCTSEMRQLGNVFTGVREVRSLDEVLLIIRKSSNLRFDEQLPGFHMYGTDICLEAHRRGMKSYAIPAFCIHNTDGYRMLPLQFWHCYLFMRKKWMSELPVATSCTEITAGCWPMIRWNIVQAANIVLKRYRAGHRVHDPSRLYLDLMALEGRNCSEGTG
jgi:hypothetical protein